MAQQEITPRIAQARLKEVVESLPAGYEERIRAHSARARQIFRNPDAVMLDVSRYYKMLADDKASDYWKGEAENSINAGFDVVGRKGVSDPDAAWRELTQVYPPVEVGDRVTSTRLGREAQNFTPIYNESDNPDDMIRRIIAFGRMRLPSSTTLLSNYYAIDSHYSSDKTPAERLEVFMRATEPRVVERVRELEPYKDMGVRFLGAVDKRPEAVDRYFKARESGYNPAAEAERLLSSRKDVSTVTDPETGLIMVGEMSEGHETIARSFGLDPKSPEYRMHVKGMMPKKPRRGEYVPTASFNFGYYDIQGDTEHHRSMSATEAIEGCVKHMAQQGFSPDTVIKVSDVHFFSNSGYRLGSLTGPESYFRVEPDHRNKDDWTCVTGNGVDVWRYNMPAGDTRVVGHTVMVKKGGIYTGDVPLTTLGGDVEVSLYCGAFIGDDGTVRLSGHIPKHGSHEPDPAGVAEVLRRFDPSLRIDVEKVTGKKIS
ncbi:MAG: hypothetical protein ABIH11_07975 [Candidatus Altiarchaeota archaeon]